MPHRELAPAAELGEQLGLLPGEIQPYGRRAAKIELTALERLGNAPDGKLVSITADHADEGGRGEDHHRDLARRGARPDRRAPRPLSPRALARPRVRDQGRRHRRRPRAARGHGPINLHFTGDIHAIGAANNLLAAMIEAHLLHGNELGIDPHSITWRRCLDMDDRALRQVVVGLGGRVNGIPRETGFDITAASEVMAIVAVSATCRPPPPARRDHRRPTFDGEPVTAEELGAAGSMAALLTDALKPNLVQTLEGEPALVHAGPSRTSRTATTPSSPTGSASSSATTS